MCWCAQICTLGNVLGAYKDMASVLHLFSALGLLGTVNKFMETEEEAL